MLVEAEGWDVKHSESVLIALKQLRRASFPHRCTIPMESSVSGIWWPGTIKHGAATQVGVNAHKSAQSHDHAHAHKEDTEESFSHDGFGCHDVFIMWSQFPLSSSSSRRVTAVIACAHTCTHAHTHTHTLYYGPTVLSIMLSLFSYLFHNDKTPIYVRPLGACLCAHAFIIYVWPMCAQTAAAVVVWACVCKCMCSKPRPFYLKDPCGRR